MKNNLNKSYNKIEIINYDLEDLLENEDFNEDIKKSIDSILNSLKENIDKLKLLEWYLNKDIKEEEYLKEIKRFNS
jgi:CRISPR/Cas system-associated endonuclease/helicase Cas3